MKRAVRIALIAICLLLSAHFVRVLVSGSHYLATEESPEYPTFYRQTPWLDAQREAMTMSNRNGMKHISLGLHNVHDVHKTFPKGTTYDSEGRALHSWITTSIVYTANAWLGQDFREEEPWDSEHNATYFRSVLIDFLNPTLPSAPVRDARGFAVSHFAANQNVIGPDLGLRMDEITDGLEQTLLFGEVNSLFRAWGGPQNWRDPALGLNQNPRGFGSHPARDGVTFGFADGSVRELSNSIDPAILRALATPKGEDDVRGFNDR